MDVIIYSIPKDENGDLSDDEDYSEIARSSDFVKYLIWQYINSSKSQYFVIGEFLQAKTITIF